MAAFRADSFHVNIDTGDGAIHILSTPGDTASFGKRKVKSAIFIDGGKTENRNKARRNIITTVEDIERGFYCQGTDRGGGVRTLVFNAFMISHWDADHCDGVLAYISSCIDSTTKRLTRAFYTDDNQRRPLSYFFAPHFLDTNKESHWHLKHKAKWICEGKCLRFENSATDLLKMRVTDDELLGRNFFYSAEIADQFDRVKNPPASIKSVQQLVEVNPPRVDGSAEKNLDAPGMYCIGVNRLALGTPVKALEEPTVTNASSICCMIIWADGHCSHYFAGDAHIALEENLMALVPRKQRVTSMKLSHHGSKTSTPRDMLTMFQPKNIVISAGGQTYCHPRKLARIQRNRGGGCRESGLTIARQDGR